MMHAPISHIAKVLPVSCHFQRYEGVRFLSLSKPVINRQKFEAKRMTKMLNKIMTGSRNPGKKAINHQHPSSHLAEFGFMKRGGLSVRPVSGKFLRRVEVLNNLFIEQITSLLATGEIAPEFLGLGIQISRVKVTSDFSAVNVYWYASGMEKDETIDALMVKTAGLLRNTLSQLKVIGIVPPIKFYKDTTFSKLQEVEQLLSKCDLLTHTHTQESFENSTETDFITESNEGNDAGVSANENTQIEDEMVHDILNIRHDRIMNEIKKALERQADKQKAIRERRLQMTSISDESDPLNENYTQDQGNLDQDIKNYRQRQHDFLKYLKQQQAEKSKELKRNSVKAKENEFYRDEIDARKTSQMMNRLDELDDFDLNDEENDNNYDDETESYYQTLRQDFK